MPWNNVWMAVGSWLWTLKSMTSVCDMFLKKKDTTEYISRNRSTCTLWKVDKEGT